MTSPGEPSVSSEGDSRWSAFDVKATRIVPLPMAELPEVIRAAVARLPRMVVRELETDRARVARHSSWPSRAISIDLQFTARDARSTIITARYRPNPLLGANDWGRGEKDLRRLLSSVSDIATKAPPAATTG
jgi:hypothetical protein